MAKRIAKKPIEKVPKKMGAPIKEINWDMFEQLCGIQCIQTEIAAFLKISIETLRNRAEQKYGETYLDVYKRFGEVGKCSLRRNQFILSKKNAAMAIWLGKHWLGQTDPDKHQTNVYVNNKEFYEAMDRTKNPLENPKIDTTPEDSYT